MPTSSFVSRAYKKTRLRHALLAITLTLASATFPALASTKLRLDIPAQDLGSACSDITGQRFYGSDAYLDGLARACGATAQALPERIEDVLSLSAQRVIVVVDLAQILQADRLLTVPGALAALDARWLAPAAAAVAGGAVRSLSVLANDRRLSFVRRDEFKRWRHARRGLAGLR